MKQPDFYDDYYEQPEVWRENLSPDEEARVSQTIARIPQDISSVLDVGCGAGWTVNRLVSKYPKVVGLDISTEALRHVKADKALGRIESLPFPDKSFDLVLCSEVLEHLPYNTCPKALAELERVARKYVLICVPNNEDLKAGLVECPYCGCLFHGSRHLRFFTPKKLATIFNRFKMQDCQPIGIPIRRYNRFFIQLARLFKLVSKTSPTALCPQCGYLPFRKETSVTSAVKSPLIPWIKRLPLGRKKLPNLIALYLREENK